MKLLKYTPMLMALFILSQQPCEEYLNPSSSYNRPDTRYEKADSKPPNVAITSPSSGVRIDRGSSVYVQVSAYDESGILKVEFRGFGESGTSYSSPWGWTVTPHRDLVPGDYTITATAYDNYGNYSSAAVTVYYW